MTLNKCTLSALVATAAILLSCTGAKEPTSDTSESPVSDLLYPSAETLRSQHALEQDFLKECMAAQGFDYELEPWQEGDMPVSPIETRSREYRVNNGLVNEDHGAEPIEPIRDNLAVALETMTEDEVISYRDQIGTCLDDSDELAQSELIELDQAVQDEMIDMFNFEHPDLLDSVDEWSACMSLSGWKFRNPNEMYQYAYQITDPGPDLADEEVKLAVDDYDCSAEDLWPAMDSLLATLDARVASTSLDDGN